MPTERPTLLLSMPETLRADAILGPEGQKAVTPKHFHFGRSLASVLAGDLNQLHRERVFA